MAVRRVKAKKEYSINRLLAANSRIIIGMRIGRQVTQVFIPTYKIKKNELNYLIKLLNKYSK